MEFLIRGARDEDYRFVRATWMRGQYGGSKYHRHLEPSAYHKMQLKKVNETLLNPLNSLRIACDASDRDLILGYAVVGWQGDNAVIHWVYIKSAFRRIGIATKLVEDLKTNIVTNITDLGNLIRKNKGFKFSPEGD